MGRREHTRRFATILFTDIVGSTDIARELGDLRWQEVVRRHHAIVRRELKRFGGHEVDTAGDGFFAIFDGPGAGIRCAVAISEGVREVGLEIRAGLHGGEVAASEGKAGGIAVNTAARVMSVAGFGEVLVSQTMRDLVAGSPIGFEDHGRHTLKGIEGEWALHRVASVDGERVAEPLDGAEAARRRLAIEPPRRPPSSGRRRATLIAAASTALLAAVVALIVLLDGGADPADGPLIRSASGPPPGSMAWVDTRTGKIAGVRSDVARNAGEVHDVEVAYGSVWMIRVPVVLKVDPEDGSSVAVSGVDANIAASLGVGLDRVWVAGRRLFPVDPATGEVGDGIAYTEGELTFLAAQDVATGFGQVWIASNDGSVIHVDPGGTGLTAIEVGDAPNRIVAGTDAMWVLDDPGDTVWRIDPRTDAVEEIPLAGGLDEVAVAGGFVWVLSEDLGTLTPISEATGDVRSGLSVGEGARDVAAGLGSVWVASGGDILEVDTTTARVIRTIEVGETPIASLAVDEETATVWLDIDTPN